MLLNIQKSNNGEDAVIDAGLLQRLQDFFCRANNIYLTCLDHEGNEVTEPYGSEEERGYISRTVDEIDYRQLVRRTLAGSVENIQEKELDEDFVRLCGIAARANGRPALVFVAFALLNERVVAADQVPDYMARTSKERFYRSVEFLEMLAREILAVKTGERRAQDELGKSEEESAAAEQKLRRSRAMTDIARALSSKAPFEEAASGVIEKTCVTLDIAEGCLLREEDGLVRAVCSHAKEDSSVLGCREGRLREELPFFDGKPYMISASSMKPSAFVRFFEECGVSAAVFDPVRAGDVLMYLCFCHVGTPGEWDVSDMKFISDVKHVLQDMLAERMAVHSLESSCSSLEGLLERADCGLCVADEENQKLLYSNRRFQELFLKTMEAGEIEGALFSGQELAKKRSHSERYLAREGRWVGVAKTGAVWKDARPVSLYTLTDITDKKVYQKKVESQAENDFVAGMLSRMRCGQDLEREIVRAKAAGGEGALLYLDLDDFKELEDRLGKAYGDALLRAILHSLQRIAGVEEYCYRIGRDEFLVIVPEREYENLDRIVGDVGSIFAEPWFMKGEDCYCSASIGAVCFPSDADTAESLIRRANMTLLEAKRRGKNRVEYYSGFRRGDTESVRASAVNAYSEFEVHYQPIMDASKDGAPCCGARALVRWNSGSVGIAGPDRFLPLAEYLGLINPVGSYVLKKAAKRCRYWNDSGHPDYGVSIGLSAAQLLQRDIVKKIRRVLEETKVNPKNLTFEVVGSVAEADGVRIRRVLGELRALGVRTALFSFGAEASSVNHLRDMPVDAVWIDRSFVGHLGEDGFSDTFVRMTAELAASVGVSVCADGVETAAQLARLQEMQVGLVQGGYFGRPMAVGVFEKLYLQGART